MIPFIRGFPSGKCTVTRVERPDDIEAIAQRFLRSNGMYLIEILPSGEVNMSAITVNSDNTHNEVAESQSHNGPELMRAIDDLVRKSAEHMVQ